ncbi:Uncharacterised protein [Yersinia similis]|nr:Uncharacterised protein [Yersinia similis]CNB68765.1 Uncharacterised protein [Yersinia similis]CNE16729.1 Uncharacterised protein [Yersinia similis]
MDTCEEVRVEKHREKGRKESECDDGEDNRWSIKLCDKQAIQGIRFYRYNIYFLRKKKRCR